MMMLLTLFTIMYCLWFVNNKSVEIEQNKNVSLKEVKETDAPWTFENVVKTSINSFQFVGVVNTICQG